MYIEHIAMYVNDLESAKAFFVKYFNAKSNDGYHNPNTSFRLGNKQSVDSLTQRLKDDGYEVLSGPRTTGDGYYESCIIALEGNLIEITE